MLLYYITDRTQFEGTDAERRTALLRTIGNAASAGVDYIQLREKDLSGRELESLVRQALCIVRAEGPSRLMVNHRADIALATGADGVHLTGDDVAPSDVRALTAGAGRSLLISVSCHSVQQVRLADAHGADFAVFGPIFEKMNMIQAGVGLSELSRAAQKDRTPDLRAEAGDTRRSFPVFALGGVNMERATLCAATGATGIAGIRLFQQCENLPSLVRTVRSL